MPGPKDVKFPMVRMRLWIASVMTAVVPRRMISSGAENVAERGGPPSPMGAVKPFRPAMVEMRPVALLMRRTTFETSSLTRMLSAASTATAQGELSVALVAKPPSPP